MPVFILKYTWLSRMECDFCLLGCSHCFLSSLYQLQDTHLQDHTLGIYVACGHVSITTSDEDRLLVTETLDVKDTFTWLIAQKSICHMIITDCNMTGNFNLLISFCSLLDSLYINTLTPGSLVSAVGSV